MLKYRVSSLSKGDQDSQQLSSARTPRINPSNDAKKSKTIDLEEANDTIPRLHPTTGNFLPVDLKSGKEIGDFLPDAVQRYKQEIEALNIENVSLKKALQQARAKSPTMPTSPHKHNSIKKSLTSIKKGTDWSPSPFKPSRVAKGAKTGLGGDKEPDCSSDRRL
jgi:hypothetical protein